MTAILSALLSKMDILVLGLMGETQSVGIYTVAARITDLALLAFMAVESIVAPMIAEFYAKRDYDQLQDLLRLSARNIFAFVLAVSLILTFTGRWVLSWFGEEFILGYWSLLILLGAHLIHAFCGSVSFLLLMTKYQVQATVIFGVGAA